MAIDVFLPTVVRQAIAIDKSDSNVSGTLIPQNDPSGEENRGVKGQPSPTALFNSSNVTKPEAAKPTPPKLATPPFADYLAQEKNKEKAQQNNQVLSPLTMQEMPPMIAEFLNDIAKQHGIAAPSQQQLQSALRMTSDYRPPKPVIIDTKTVKPNKPETDKPETDKPEIAISETMKPETMKPEMPVVTPSPAKQPEPKQTDSKYSPELKAGFDELSTDTQKSALDYGRMLEALNRYSVTIQDNN